MSFRNLIVKWQHWISCISVNIVINSLTSIYWEAPFVLIVWNNLIISLYLLIDWLYMLLCLSLRLTHIEVVWSYLVLEKLLILSLLLDTAFLVTLVWSIDINDLLRLHIVVAKSWWMKLTLDHVEMSSKLCSLKVIIGESAINPRIDLIIASLDLYLPWSLLLASVCLEWFLILLFIHLRLLVLFMMVFLNKFLFFIMGRRWNITHICIRKRDIRNSASPSLRSHIEFSSQLDRGNLIKINWIFIQSIGSLSRENVAR